MKTNVQKYQYNFIGLKWYKANKSSIKAVTGIMSVDLKVNFTNQIK
jgi:hypothetical protein